MNKSEIKKKIMELEKSFIRDRWGNLQPCYWNEKIKKDILHLEDQL